MRLGRNAQRPINSTGKILFQVSGENTGVTICLSKCQKPSFFNASFRKMVEEDILPHLFKEKKIRPQLEIFQLNIS